MCSTNLENDCQIFNNGYNEMREDRILAEIIKETHAKLREKVQSVNDDLSANKIETEDTIWNEHADERMSVKLEEHSKCNTSAQLCYSEAMKKLADNHWCHNIEKRKNEGERSSRIEWLIKHINKYRQCDHQKFQERLLKRKHYDKVKTISDSLDKNPNKGLLKKKINNDTYNILDVGSCYNPLSDQFPNDNVKVTAIDLSPSSKSVYKCDFLRVPIVEISKCVVMTKDEASDSVESLKENGYDVIIFCLLLEYLPSPRLRYKACERAKRLLKTNGLLLIVTPDSSRNHAKNERQMKSWRLALANMGMLRIYIENQKHLRFLGFVKVDQETFGDICIEEAEKIKNKVLNKNRNTSGINTSNSEDFVMDERLMFIPQDKTTQLLLKQSLNIEHNQDLEASSAEEAHLQEFLGDFSL